MQRNTKYEEFDAAYNKCLESVKSEKATEADIDLGILEVLQKALRILNTKPVKNTKIPIG